MLLSQYFYNCWDLNSLLIKKKEKKRKEKVKSTNISTLISQQILSAKLLLMHKISDIDCGLSLKSVITCHL